MRAPSERSASSGLALGALLAVLVVLLTVIAATVTYSQNLGSVTVAVRGRLAGVPQAGGVEVTYLLVLPRGVARPEADGALAVALEGVAVAELDAWDALDKPVAVRLREDGTSVAALLVSVCVRQTVLDRLLNRTRTPGVDALVGGVGLVRSGRVKWVDCSMRVARLERNAEGKLVWELDLGALEFP